MGVQERLFRIHTTPTLSIFNAPPAADQCQWLGLVAWRGHYYQQYCRLVSHSQTPTRQHSNCRSNMESVPETPLYSLYNPVVVWESGCLRLSDTDTDRQQEVHLLYCSWKRWCSVDPEQAFLYSHPNCRWRMESIAESPLYYLYNPVIFPTALNCWSIELLKHWILKQSQL